MAQIFTTDFGWSQSCPMSCKDEAHEDLGLLFTREGVPPKMIVDNAKEMKLEEFARKCKEAYCYLQSMEPYSPWSNSAEHEIRALKNGAARKLTRSGAPCHMWCFTLDYESYVHLHTAHDIYRLDGRVPETVVSGETEILALSVNSAFGIGLNSRSMAWPSPTMPWYLANSWVPVLM